MARLDPDVVLDELLRILRRRPDRDVEAPAGGDLRGIRLPIAALDVNRSGIRFRAIENLQEVLVRSERLGERGVVAEVSLRRGGRDRGDRLRLRLEFFSRLELLRVVEAALREEHLPLLVVLRARGFCLRARILSGQRQHTNRRHRDAHLHGAGS